ncbi:MAG: hypothetical protein Q4E75_05100 [bacterium]|nr:hypothetical protein [bacterium]
MKKFVCKQKNCFIALTILVLVIETLLKIDNKFVQTLGILMTPMLIMFGLIIIKNDQKKVN